MAQSPAILKIAAFSDGNTGGNPAGVVIGPHQSSAKMQQIAAEIGFSETAFADQLPEGYRVRYFSPQSEVPFCGHATIALGAALTKQNGAGVYTLQLNDATISVEGKQLTTTSDASSDGLIAATLQSPPTHSAIASEALVAETLKLFNYTTADLDLRIAPATANAGASHMIMMLKSRETLSRMQYDLDAGKQLMDREGWVTILFGYIESNTHFHTRNAFASGGVLEDPATGAASAALAGLLRDIDWPHSGQVQIVQGEDMGMRSLITADFDNTPGSSIRVSGTARFMKENE